nr:immunoglobulin light chain junction region [Macaca mulatta]
CQHYNIDPPTF